MKKWKEIKIKPSWILKGFYSFPLVLNTPIKKFLLKNGLATITGDYEITLVENWFEKLKDK